MCARHVDGSVRTVAVGGLVVGLSHPHAVACGLCPVAARRHVTPTTSPVLGPVEEHSWASPVGAPANPRQLANDQRVRRALDDRNHQPGERVANGNEAAGEAAIAFRLETPRTGAPSENPVDFGQGIDPRLFGCVASFGERTK